MIWFPASCATPLTRIVSVLFPALLGAAAVLAIPVAAQGPGAAAGARVPATPARSYSPPRTSWGHPDLQGIYSNDDETGTPMARPAQFAGRTLDSITPTRWSAINRQRNEQFNAGVAGTEFAGGLRPPTHLIFDTFERATNAPGSSSIRRTASSRRGCRRRAGAAAAWWRPGGGAVARASAPTPTRTVRSTAGSTWGCTIAASRAAFPRR